MSGIVGSGFSPREWQILRALATGKTYGAVAADVGLTIQTVKNHMTSVHRKAGRSTTIEILMLLDDYRPGWRERMPHPMGAVA